MKISNVSKIVLIIACAVIGNAAYRTLQNRTHCCGQAHEEACAAPADSCCATACSEAGHESVYAKATPDAAATVMTVATADAEHNTIEVAANRYQAMDTSDDSDETDIDINDEAEADEDEENVP